MKIGAFSARCGLSAYTLRYYEGLGLLEVHKDASGHRDYSEADLAWVEFITRLKATSMPLMEIRSFSRLRAQGEASLGQRLALLLTHADRLDRRIHELEGDRAKLGEKIRHYQDQLKPK